MGVTKGGESLDVTEPPLRVKLLGQGWQAVLRLGGSRPPPDQALSGGGIGRVQVTTTRALHLIISIGHAASDLAFVLSSERRKSFPLHSCRSLPAPWPCVVSGAKALALPQ